MKRLLIFGLLAATVFIETMAQHGPEYQLKVIQATKTTKKLERILFFSAGSTHDRLFADNLNHALQSQLKRKTATISYQFLPLSDSDTSIEVNPVTAAAYDAVLLLVPDSLSALSIRTKRTWNGSDLLSANAPAPPTKQYSRKIRYQQDFSISVLDYKQAENTRPLWLASLYVNFDPTVEKVYNGIADELVKQFRKNGLID